MDPTNSPIRPFEPDPLDIEQCAELVQTSEPSPSGQQPKGASAFVFGHTQALSSSVTMQILKDSGDPRPLSPMISKPLWARTRTISDGSSSSIVSNSASIENIPSTNADFCIAELESMVFSDRRSSASSSLVEFIHSELPNSPIPEIVVEQPLARVEASPKRKAAARLDLSLSNLKSLSSTLRHTLPLEQSTLTTIKKMVHEDFDNPFRSTHIEAITLCGEDRPAFVRRRREILPGRTEQAFKEFLREQKIHARLHHPCIVQHHGCDILELDGKLFLDTYTAYAGESANNHFRRNRNMHPSQFIPLACQLFSAIAHLASEGVIHRDISPDNILIDGESLKLIDFELAYSHEFSNPVSMHSMQGNLLYMAPELNRGIKASYRSDTYGAAMTALKLMEHMGLIDRSQIRKDFNQTTRQWYTPRTEMLPPLKSTNIKHWQMYKGALDILNLSTNDDPAQRLSPLETEQRLSQLLIGTTSTEQYDETSACKPDLPTPVSENHPLLTTLVSGNEKNGAGP